MAFPGFETITETRRPFWSVMIPTWEPRPEWLARAITSVTEQIRQRADVQVEVVDDASHRFDVGAFVAGLRVEGVSPHRNERRLGLADNWNACIARAKGRWVHILHQDDFVLPGFYAALEEGIERVPDAGAAFCDTYFVDAAGRHRRYTTIPQTVAGVLADWREHVFVRLAIQTPAIVVRRDVYEAVGGFDDDFEYALDWDLWKRIAVRYPIWYDPRPLACYLMHGHSQTAFLRQSGRNVTELASSMVRSQALLGDGDASVVAQRARRAYAALAVESAFGSLFRERSPAAAWTQLAAASRAWSPRDVARALCWVSVRFGVRAAEGVVGRLIGRSDADGR